ncbi:hypothetical protein PspLS_03754 [Pyricularia sp. CBS 133598]|nr:hypothetical protein PspLS_03754 [Pyricularia sp. CBS 133598]
MAQQSQKAIIDTNPADPRLLKLNERLSAIPALEMLKRALALPNSPPQPFRTVLDNACGAAVVTCQLLDSGLPTDQLTRIVAADIDPRMMAWVAEWAVQQEQGWAGRGVVEVMTFDQQANPLPDETFSHVFNNFGVFMSRNDTKTLVETLRVLEHGGLAGFTSWVDILWWDRLAVPAVRRFIPDAPEMPDIKTILPEHGWSSTASARARMESVGFVDVVAEEFTFSPDIPGHDFAQAIGVVTRTMVGMKWCAEDYERFADQIEGALDKFIDQDFGGRWNVEVTAVISLGRKA